MITLTLTPTGLILTRDQASYTVSDPAALARLIAQLTTDLRPTSATVAPRAPTNERRRPMASTGLTDRQRAILSAIEGGATTMRDIARAAGVSSTSVVQSNLQRLAAGGHVVLQRSAHGLTVARGEDYCAAWDAAARLMGNPDA